ncbi:nucleobase:cation symporter-2 family protein [Corynebacterium choanae]|uniref:nucleobase:cation symporter-2 family protein n=1 Tax=Corynebacterium choanae TaxID=1862358 RepID=UPI0019D05E60|nr:nucleobase:cation symporter-2 family protein [Corynebacterium choanae]
MSEATAQRADQSSVSPVDQIPPGKVLWPMAFQHVLAMYAGAVAVPLVLGGAMIQAGQMQPSDLPYLITADLLVAGIATILQCVGFWRFGARLPIVQGCTFTAVPPMIIIGQNYGPAAIYGSVLACGLFMMLMAPIFARILWMFPPLVTGTLITIVGLSLIPVAASNIAGGNAPDAGSMSNIALGFFTLAVVLVVERFAPPAMARTSVLIGLLVGTIVAAFAGKVDLSGVADEQWLGVATPFHFGLPEFPPSAVIALILVALVTLVEATGDFLAAGEIVEKKTTPQQIADGLRADGFSTMLGGVFNTFPYTAFAQNIGLLAMSRVRSRYVVAGCGAILILLGLLPKLGAVIAAIPTPVLGGATGALFGMIAASGMKTLSKLEINENSLIVIAVSVTIGLLPVMYPDLFQEFPSWFTTMFNSGITTGALAAILLNLFFFGTRRVPANAGRELATADTAYADASMYKNDPASRSS